MSGVQRAAVAAFTLLVAATFGAFFVAQSLKGGPSILQKVTVRPIFSPNSDSRLDEARFAFMTREDDEVRVDVVDEGNDFVRTIFDDHIEAYTNTRMTWDGRDEDGELAPDGLYRIQVTLRDQGRSIVVPRSFELDVTPPHPRIRGIGPVQSNRPQPEYLPNPDGEPVRVSFGKAGRSKRILVFKTGPDEVRPAFAPVELPEGATEWTWDGTVGGRRVSPGTYLVVLETRDRAGNIGTSVPLDEDGLPVARYGEGYGGKGGITVRYLAVQPPILPTSAGERATFGVDARQERYTWNLRRVGGPPNPIRDGSGTRSLLRIQAPAGEGGVYLLEVRTATRSVRVPWVVRPETRRIGTPAEPGGVLVVLPMGTWQGRNPVDDDGDGYADMLDRGLPVRLERPLVGDGTGLPVGFAQRAAPLLGHLDREGRRYDVTTDVALAAGVGPRPAEGYAGVLLPGDTRWLDPRAARRLRSFVRDGGTLATFGTDSLRREVRLTPGRRLIDPTVPAATDLFGATLRPVEIGPVTLTELVDTTALFEGTDGEFDDVERFETIASLGADSERIAAAVTPRNRPAILATRVGSSGGRVVRIPLPGLPSRLSSDPELAQLVRNTWILLSR